jgi:hypothetical protein
MERLTVQEPRKQIQTYGLGKQTNCQPTATPDGMVGLVGLRYLAQLGSIQLLKNTETTHISFSK